MKIQSITSDFEALKEELRNDFVEQELKREIMEKNRLEMIRLRKNDEAMESAGINKKNNKNK